MTTTQSISTTNFIKTKLYLLLPALVLLSSCQAQKGYGKEYLLFTLLFFSPIIISTLIVLLRMEVKRRKKLKKAYSAINLKKHKTILTISGVIIFVILIVNNLPIETKKNSTEEFIKDIHAMDHKSAIKTYGSTFLGKNNINQLLPLSYKLYKTERLPDWKGLPLEIESLEKNCTDNFKNNRVACNWLMSKNTYYFYQLIDSLPIENYGTSFILGIDQLQKENYQNAINHYKKSIEKSEFLSGSTQELSTLLFRLNRFEELGHVMNNKNLVDFVPIIIQREYYYKNSSYLNYLHSVIKSHLKNVNVFGFIGAFLILICWFVLLRMINPFFTESLFYSGLAFITSCILAFCSSFIYDYVFYTLEFKGQENLFIYCFGVVGPIEELMKIIPFIIVLSLSKDFKEPFSYIYYACICALGFSFVENFAVYLSSDKIDIIQGRGLIATFGHMFDLSIVGYVILIGKNKRSTAVSIFIGLLLAIFSHGLYDLILFKELHPFVFFILFFIMIQFWSDMANNALNVSTNFKWSKLKKYTNIKFYFSFSLVIIILSEYVLLAIQMGPEVANDALAGNIFLGLLLVMYLGLSLTNYDFFPGHIAKIQPPYQVKDIVFPKIVNDENFVGANILIEKIKRSKFFPIEGKIVARHLVKNDSDFYLVHSNKALTTNNSYYNDFMLIQFNEYDASIVEFKKCSVGCFLVSKKENLRKISIKHTSLKQISSNAHLSELKL